MNKEFFAPLTKALKTFVREVPDTTKSGPHVRDGVDLKRWMMLVVFALMPCIVMAIWNTGVQSFVYGSGDLSLHARYVEASHSLQGYFAFCRGHVGQIVWGGLRAFLPIVIITYAVGGFWEFLFAAMRRHEISEGFLVTGILYALILPSTIPYWMVAVGISVGVVLGKELFGGTGMNIFNPALVARCFLFFTFPVCMTGDIWVGTNPTVVARSVAAMDGVSQQSPLGTFNISSEVKRIHIETIGAYLRDPSSMSFTELEAKVTGPQKLSPELFQNAVRFAKLRYGEGMQTPWNFFFGNRIGSMGETSVLAALLGATLLLLVGIASWQIMVAMALGGLGTALLFEWGAHLAGAWVPAKFAFPAYKHLLIGSFAFGLVFMATEPVTAPKRISAKWWYGALIGVVVIVIRTINPAFPEGVMLAILFANVFSPLFDHYALKRYRRGRYAKV